MKSNAAKGARQSPSPGATSPDRMVNGKRMVLLEESEYERLRAKADEWEPVLPEPDANGNYPAVAYARASLARKIIRHRRRLGLTQVELALRAGIRPETLNRLEHAKHTPAVATVAPRAGSFIQETMKARAKVGTASTTNVVLHPHTPTSTPAIGPPTRPMDVPTRWMPCTRGSSDGG